MLPIAATAETRVRADDYLDLRGSIEHRTISASAWLAFEIAKLVSYDKASGLVTLLGGAKALWTRLQAEPLPTKHVVVRDLNDLLKGDL